MYNWVQDCGKCPNVLLKVLFIHNAMPEYRIAFWQELSKFIDLTILITRKNLENRIYALNKKESGLSIIYLNAENIFELVSEIRKYDVVILPPADAIKECGIGGMVILLCKMASVKVVYWTEKWEADRVRCPMKKRIKNAIQRVVIGMLAAKSDICVAAGSKSLEYLQKLHIKKNRIRIAYDSSTSPEPAKLIDFEEEYGISHTQKVILYFGRIIRRKGIMLLLEAFKKMREPEVVLMVCGTGDYESECKAYVKNYNIDNVIFVGKIQPEVRKNFFLRADVFVLPSYIDKGIVEAWGLTVNEALEVGTPVIATTAVGSAFDLLSDINGVIVEDACVEKLYLALKHMISNSTGNRAKIRNSYSNFSVGKMAKSFADAIEASVYN